MKDHDSATDLISGLLHPRRSGIWWGLLGVAAFSLTVPLTRVAVRDGLDPLLVGAGRAVVAALLAGACLAVSRQPIPKARQVVRLLLVTGGVVIGFPVLTSYALTTSSASHGAVIVALLPVATAITVVARDREDVGIGFWLASGAGACAAVAFAVTQGEGVGAVGWPDLLLLVAVAAAAIGYAEGGLLARELGAWQTISWALVMATPVTAGLTALTLVRDAPSGGTTAWAAFAYLAVVSMFLGFFAWYRGLAMGPMSRVSQVQLVQPVMSIMWAAVLLREDLTPSIVAGGLVVIVCAGLAVRQRTAAPSRPLEVRR